MAIIMCEHDTCDNHLAGRCALQSIEIDSRGMCRSYTVSDNPKGDIRKPNDHRYGCACPECMDSM